MNLFALHAPTRRLLLFFALVFGAAPTRSTAQALGSLSGTVVDKATQAPLTGVAVALANTAFGSITDSNGSFRLLNIPANTYNAVFSTLGYQKLVLDNIIVVSGNEKNFLVEMEAEAANLQSVTVSANRKTAIARSLETPLSVQRLTTEEIKSNPGGNFDISKVIQALPGVGGGASSVARNDIIIRGGAPNENVFYLDGIEIPVINHFQTQGSTGGPQGILNVSFIEDVKLSSSAFDARYDNALSSVFQFRQKNGNPNRIQGNIRLSATELAGTFEGPLTKDRKTTFLASARRSYLQLLFQTIDLPIRPNYWDFQTKITRQIDKRTTLSFVGIGAIDEFSFAAPREATANKLYTISSSPSINQWNYTVGFNLKRLIKNGYWNLAVSRNSFDNRLDKYEDNQKPKETPLVLDIRSRETENKLRFDVNKNRNGWKWSYGLSGQWATYENKTFNVLRKEITDSAGALLQPGVQIRFESPLDGFARVGAFAQGGKRFFNERLGVSAGIRTDMNSFTESGWDALATLSPRVALSYSLNDQWSLNASYGIYYKLPSYTILGFADNNGSLINKNAKYQRATHYVAGLEFLPNNLLRFTAEGFYKDYGNVPVSRRDGISLANLGAEFGVVGNEPIVSNGKGRTYGFELFAQQKLSRKFFGIVSYTWFRSEYSGAKGVLTPSAWDSRNLLSVTLGYKLPRNWELGLKFRYQGGSPYTPYDIAASKLNFLSQGVGVLDYNQLNSRRIASFNSSDVRIDKKWNFKGVTLDLFLDVTNWYATPNVAAPTFIFERTADNKTFKTTDGNPLRADGSNGIPVLLEDNDAVVLPTIGFIVEF